MKRISAILVLAAVAASTGAAVSADFQLDMSAADIRKAESKYILSDLAVGEKGILGYSILCAENGVLKVNGRSALADDRKSFGMIWSATKLPGGSISLELLPSKRGERTVRGDVIDRLLALQDCNRTAFPDEEMIPVRDINGMSSISEILRTPKD